jgi:hypothetical protein
MAVSQTLGGALTVLRVVRRTLSCMRTLTLSRVLKETRAGSETLRKLVTASQALSDTAHVLRASARTVSHMVRGMLTCEHALARLWALTGTRTLEETPGALGMLRALDRTMLPGLDGFCTVSDGTAGARVSTAGAGT